MEKPEKKIVADDNKVEDLDQVPEDEKTLIDDLEKIVEELERKKKASDYS